MKTRRFYVNTRPAMSLITPVGCAGADCRCGLNPMGGFFDSLASVFTTPVTTDGPNAGAFFDVNVHGSKVAADRVFTSDFLNSRTPASVQGVANMISAGTVTVRADGSVGNATSTVAPVGSVDVAAYRALAPSAAVAAPSSSSVFSSADAPSTPSDLVGGSFTTLTQGISNFFTGTTPASQPGTLTPAPIWIMPSFALVATKDRIDRIVSYLSSGLASVYGDGSVRSGTSIFAPAGSVNVNSYRSMTGGQVLPVPSTAPAPAPAVAQASVGGGILGSLGTAVGNIFNTALGTAVKVGTQSAVSSITDRLTPATNNNATLIQQQMLTTQANQAQAALQAQQTAFNQQQAALQAQLAAQQSEIEKQKIAAQIAAQQAAFDNQNATAQAQIAALRQQTEALRAASSVPVSGPVISPPQIQSMLSTAMPSALPYFPNVASSSQTTALRAGDVAGLAGTPVAPQGMSTTAKVLLGLAVAALVIGGGIAISRRRRSR